MKLQSNFCPYAYFGVKLQPARDIFSPNPSKKEGAWVAACCEQRPVFASNVDEIEKELYDIRQQFNKGEKPESCIRCWRSEKSGIRSKRQTAIESEEFKPFNLNKPEIRTADLEFSTKCNLACTVCSSVKSSLWDKQPTFTVTPAEAHQFSMSHQGYPELNEYGLIEQYFEKHKDTIRRIEISGGEPTLHEQVLEIFKTTPQNVIINFTTNCTTNFDEILNRYPNTECILSIDGVKESYEYTRWPGKWNKVVKRLSNIRNKNQIAEINSVLQPFNIFDLPEMYEMFNAYKFRPIWNLAGKNFHDIMYMPPQVLEEAVFNFLDAGYSGRNYDIISEVLIGKVKEAYAIDDSLRNSAQNVFFRYVKYIEENRDVSYKNLHPSLVKWIDECGQLN